MTHYQKIAAIIFRAVAVIVLIIGLLYLIWGVTFGLSWGIHPMMILIIFLPYLIGSAGLFVSSKLLAKLVCFDFDKTDEK